MATGPVRGTVWLWVAVAGAACGGGAPTQPLPPSTPTAPAAFTTAVRAVDVLSGLALSGVIAAGTDVSGGPSGATGSLTVGSASSNAAVRGVTLSVAGYVSRQVAMKVPGGDVTVSMIPSSFSLTAFDELLRVTRLQRWTSAPPLRIQSRTLQFTSVGAAEAVAIDDVMSEEERNALEADLSWALPQLSGNAFQAFAGITRETIAVDERMQVLNTGVITVARYAGLTAATGFWGYSRWQFRTDGTVIGGTIMLDLNFERSGSSFRRSLHAHELGHALGYTHVTALTSVMNSNARTEPNAFDRQATLIAFQRPPGNIRPDADPADVSQNTAAAGAIWSVGAGAGSYGSYGSKEKMRQ